MTVAQRPEAIDSRLVFLGYAWTAIVGGLAAYSWGPMWLMELHLPSLPFGRAAILRSCAALVTASGLCAAAFAQIQEPVARRRGLGWFAMAHLVFGALFFGQWFAILGTVLPPAFGWSALVVGAVLLYLAVTGPGDVAGPISQTIHRADGTVRRDVMIRSKRTIEALRSEYEERIRQAVRQEERARLARDLHDAVKQQLFVIQTAAATAQTRFDTDAAGAKTALEQVRSSARDAMTEMEAMLDQLQAAPLENAGLVASLRKHCEALGFRTGADVSFELGNLPTELSLAPGAREAILRAAQEALANVARHARARRVQVTLGTEGRYLALTVRDDGSGCEARPAPSGMGLANMAGRAQEAGGAFELHSAPGAGTTVRFSVPCGTRPPHEYAARAAIWSVLLILGLGVCVLGGPTLRPWAAAFTTIAVVGVNRYVVAAYRARRAGRSG